MFIVKECSETQVLDREQLGTGSEGARSARSVRESHLFLLWA